MARGRPKKIDVRPAAHPLRIKAFFIEFSSRLLNAPFGQKLTIKDIQYVLATRPHELTLSIEDITLRAWRSGDDFPSEAYVKWINREWPGCTDWLNPDINSSATRRFFCALDIWGSPIISPARKLDTTLQIISAGNVVDVLARRWMPMRIVDKWGALYGFVIPRLKCRIPKQIHSDVYKKNNHLTVLDYMFRSGAYLELQPEDFIEWALDLASLTLLIAAFYEATPVLERDQLGRTGDYLAILDSLFFKQHGTWPNLNSLKKRLEDFPELGDMVPAYSQRLIDAREAIENELLTIETDLTIVKSIENKVKNAEQMWQIPYTGYNETINESDLIQVKRNISSAAPDGYKYEFKYLKGDKPVVLCHNLKNRSKDPLCERPDLYNGYNGNMCWGYSGAGPTFLTISLLAHHLGHSDFGTEEIARLLTNYISLLPVELNNTSCFLTTYLIDRCLNEKQIIHT